MDLEQTDMDELPTYITSIHYSHGIITYLPQRIIIIVIIIAVTTTTVL